MLLKALPCVVVDPIPLQHFQFAADGTVNVSGAIRTVSPLHEHALSQE